MHDRTLTTCGAAGTDPEDKKVSKMMTIPAVVLVHSSGLNNVFLDVAAADTLKMNMTKWIKTKLQSCKKQQTIDPLQTLPHHRLEKQKSCMLATERNLAFIRRF